GSGKWIRVPPRLGVPPASRLEPIQAEAAQDRGQPARRVLDPCAAMLGRPEPGVLHRIVGVGQGAEEAKGDRPQVRTGPFERGFESNSLFHRSPFLPAGRHPDANQDARRKKSPMTKLLL